MGHCEMTDKSRSEPLTLTIFIEPGSSLKQFGAKGMLGRYYGYFQALCDLGMRIYLLSYAGRSELEYAPSSPDIKVLCNRFGLPDRTYWRRVHQLHALPLLRSDIIRSRNIHGVRAALRTHWAWGMPIVCRIDFLWTTSLETKPEVSPELLQEAYEYERHTFATVTHNMPTTSDMAETAVKRAPEAAGKTTVVSFHVDCNLFKPMAIEKRYDLVYVGWLYRIKNLEATLEAVERTGASIAIIGGVDKDVNGNPIDPEVAERLKARFGNKDRIHWLGIKPNEELPAYINQAKALILCSLSEGQARCILEALACGIPVICSGIGSIPSAVRHEETGYLCETDVDSIAHAIKTVLSRPRKIEEMGANARKFALETFSMPAIARQEYELLLDIARRNPVENAAKRLAKYVIRKR
jgi:glycosyltransferase involved in cell wall biosynthesis